MFDMAGFLIVLVAAGVGAAVLFGGPAVGMDEAKAPGIAFIVAGALSMLMSWQQGGAGTRNSILFVPMWGWGIGAVIIGVVALAVKMPTGMTAERKQEIKAIEKSLYTRRKSGNNPLAQKLAAKLHSNAQPLSKRLGAGLDITVYVEADAKEENAIKHLTLYVRSVKASTMSKANKQEFIAGMIGLLRSDYPTVVCAAALRGRDKWHAHGFANPRNPARVTVDNEMPDF